MSITQNNFIGGDFVKAQNHKRIDNLEPATGQLLSTIPRSGAQAIDEAVTAAEQALKGDWGASTTEERAGFCEAIARGIEDRFEEFATLESRDTGKPLNLTKAVDIPRSIANFRFFAGAVRHASAGCHEMPTAINYTLTRPLGIVGLITPWNLPLYLLSWKTAPALAMGNAVIAKPSEMTPLSAGALAEVIQDVGLPAGAFNLVQGYGFETGQALVEHPGIQGISFTGGTETGAKVAASAASSFKKLSLELGGKNATIVFADADFEQAACGAVRAGFLNQGQICLCGSRVFVQRDIHDEFLAALIERVSAMRVGDPADPNTDLGSLISRTHRKKVESYISLAQDEGGRICIGGERPDLPKAQQQGAFLQPTIISELDPMCRTATEEIFGPVITVHPFDTEDEVVHLANHVRYGLSASVWTQDLSRAHRVSAALQTGMVWVNTWLLRDLRVPFGGIKDSGVGREGGRHSLEFFSESKNICIHLG